VKVDRSTLVEAVRICACFNLRRASRAVTRFYDEVLEQGGLRSTGFVALVAIEIEGNPTLPRLARALGVDRSTLTRNLQPLARAGFVSVASSPGGRTATARLTPKGRAAMLRCIPLWKEAQDRFETHVGGKRWNDALATLSRASTVHPDDPPDA
jgi:DNA-binding MarR family transcriptional regulator